MLKILDTGIFLSLSYIFRLLTIPDTSVTLRIAQTPNHAPIIKFIEPSGKTAQIWNKPVPYSVEVSDQEDGESRFQEITSTEVLVKLKYEESQAKASLYLKQKKFVDSIGVNSMLMSNCFNCHAVKMKLAGPSFLDISNRYQNSNKNRDLLVNHIKKGSAGIWGKEAMPSHPEISDSLAVKMVKWILNYAKDPGLNYLVGLQGSLPLNRPKASTQRGLYIVEAFYTDHGTVDLPDRKLTGSSFMIIQMK